MRKAYDFSGYPYRAFFHDVSEAKGLYIDMEHDLVGVSVSFNYLDRTYSLSDFKHPEYTDSIAFLKGFLEENGWKEEKEEKEE